MKKLLSTVILALCCIGVSAQSFEGKVIYNSTYESKLPNVSSEQFTAMAGNTITYYMKGGDYRSDCNGTVVKWQIYINNDNKLYNKLSSTETIFWQDGSVNTDSVLSVQLNKNTTEILGYSCDELILNCKSGVEKYYFTSKFPIDSKLYSKQVFQNWAAYLNLANAMPLKMVIENSTVNVTMVATSITPMKLDDSLFTLPAGAQTAKAPN